MPKCDACDAKKVKVGVCGYCDADLCEDCCRPDCEWDEDCEDLCCMYCWLEDAAEGKTIEELKAEHRAPKPKKKVKLVVVKKLEQYATCDDCGRNCYTGGEKHPDGYTCEDCEEEE